MLEMFDDVLWLRVKLRCRTSSDRCRSAAHDYIAKFPDNSDRAAIASQITNR
jgi:hypothetical protein